MKPRVLGWASMALALLSLASAHDGSQAAGTARSTRIDPTQSHRFEVVAAASGRFQALLTSSGRVFAATHLGLFASEDRGLTWRLVDRLAGVDVHGLARDAATGRLFAATGAGLFASDDCGLHWRDDSGGLPGRDLHAIGIDAQRPANLYVWDVRHGLLRRAASRVRWEQLAEPGALPPVESLAVKGADPRRLYAGTARGVWISEDGGRGWTRPVAGLDLRTAGIIALPGNPGRLLAATREGVFEGTDDAQRWRRLAGSPSFRGQPVVLAAIPARPETLLAASHEGVMARHASRDEPWVPFSRTAD